MVSRGRWVQVVNPSVVLSQISQNAGGQNVELDADARLGRHLLYACMHSVSPVPARALQSSSTSMPPG